LVLPGHTPPDAVLRSVGSALLVAVACAAGWAVVARATATGASWAILLAGAAVVAFVVFLGLGEALLFRSALLPRLEAMHAAEGAADPAGLAEREREATDFLQYLQIEAGLGWLLAAGAGAWLAARIPRLPPAVAVFVRTGVSAPAPPGSPAPQPAAPR